MTRSPFGHAALFYLFNIEVYTSYTLKIQKQWKREWKTGRKYPKNHKNETVHIVY